MMRNRNRGLLLMAFLEIGQKRVDPDFPSLHYWSMCTPTLKIISALLMDNVDKGRRRAEMSMHVNVPLPVVDNDVTTLFKPGHRLGNQVLFKLSSPWRKNNSLQPLSRFNNSQTLEINLNLVGQDFRCQNSKTLNLKGSSASPQIRFTFEVEQIGIIPAMIENKILKHKKYKKWIY